MVHTSFPLHVTLALQPCIFESSLLITGVIGLPLIDENNTAIIEFFPCIVVILKFALYKSSNRDVNCEQSLISFKVSG